MQHKKQSTMTGNLDDVLSVPQPLSQFHGTFHGMKITNWFITWHGNCLLTRFNFSIKILLATIPFLFWILLCYLLNMYRLSELVVFLGVALLCCSAALPIVLPVFGYMFASVPAFRRCSVFRSSVFRCPTRGSHF